MYSALDLSSTSFDNKFWDNLLLMDFGSCFQKLCLRWMIRINIYIYRVVVWFSGQLVRLVFKFNVKSRKSTDVMLVATVIERPQSLKILIIFYFICSICGPDNLSNTPRPSLPYKPMLFLYIILLNLFKIKITTSSQISAPS